MNFAANVRAAWMLGVRTAGRIAGAVFGWLIVNEIKRQERR